MTVPELHYRAGATVRGHLPGHHRSHCGDGGIEFRGHAPLWAAPDPRRLDLHASLRDPFGEWQVRLHSQRLSMAVVMVADLSASMAFEGRRRKLDVLADFVASLAWSAWRVRDRFGFIGCDTVVRQDWLHLPVRASATGAALAQALRGFTPAGPSARSAAGLLLAPAWLQRQRALVFLVSDFHLPLAQVQQVLAGLAAHAVVPVVLWDPLEFTLGSVSGLLHTHDPESGRRRLVWWRPALRERWQRAHEARRAALKQIFTAQGLRPLFVEGGFDADAVTRHFLL